MPETAFPAFSDFPPDFCCKTVTSLLAAVKAGQNIQLVGPVGSGKTLLLRALATSSQILKFHTHDFARLKFVYIDLNLIPDKSSKNIAAFLHPNFHFTPDQHIVLMFDSFLDISSPDLVDIHIWLYSQFNLHRGQLTYIFAVNQPLTNPVDLAVFHDLDQLIAEKIIFLPPLTPEDALWFIDANLTRLGKSLSPSQKNELYRLSGGFAQTLKRLVEAGDDYTTDVHLTYHLNKLYRDLRPLLSNRTTLHQMGLIDTEGQLTNRLLADYIAKKSTPSTENLTASETKAYTYLYAHQDQLVSREDLIAAIWGTSLHPEASDHALDQLIHRLKQKLTSSGHALSTIRGRGHHLSPTA